MLHVYLYLLHQLINQYSSSKQVLLKIQALTWKKNRKYVVTIDEPSALITKQIEHFGEPE